MDPNQAAAALESIGATLVPLAQGPKDHLLTRASLRPTGALVGHFIGLKNKPTLRVYGQQDLNLHQMRREPKSRASTFFAMPVTAQPPRFVGWGSRRDDTLASHQVQVAPYGLYPNIEYPPF